LGIRKRSFDFQRKIFCTFSVTDSTSGTSSRVRPRTPHHEKRVLMFATHAAWSLAPRATPSLSQPRRGGRSAGHEAPQHGWVSRVAPCERSVSVTARLSRPSLRSSDGNAVPAAFRYASHRTSTKSGVSLGAVAAKSAAGATDNERVDPTVNPKNGIRVAYQGMPGAYSEAAAFAAYPHCEPCPCPQFENAFEATEQWTCDRAVLPFENSLGGSIHRNYDLILTHRLHVVGEVYFKVNHCLLALPGQKMGDITRAMSHPQALAQCDGYLTNLNGGVVKEAVDDTAGAAAHIAANKLMGAYFPITKSRLPDCPYETDTLFFISRRRRGGQRARRFAIRHGDLRQRHTG
jgi:hypothetical protein